jgi:hypothetical protein
MMHKRNVVTSNLCIFLYVVCTFLIGGRTFSKKKEEEREQLLYDCLQGGELASQEAQRVAHEEDWKNFFDERDCS